MNQTESRQMRDKNLNLMLFYWNDVENKYLQTLPCGLKQKTRKKISNAIDESNIKELNHIWYSFKIVCWLCAVAICNNYRVLQ